MTRTILPEVGSTGAPRARPRILPWRGCLAVALAAGCMAAPAYAETVQASGVGQAKVRVSAPLTQLKISRAVERARDLAVPRAFINTQVQAVRYSQAAGLTLGSILAVAEPVASPFSYYGNSLARFGGNQYCGKVTTVKRRTVDGKRTVVSRRTRYRCFKPELITVSVSLTYAAAPAPPAAP